MTDRAIVVAGGHAPPGPVEAGDAFVVAADSGLDRAMEMGLPVDLVVGDLDSVDPDNLARARAAGVEVEDHPADKDATDLELALQACVRRGAGAIRVLALDGGRPDHWLANVALVCSQRWAGLELTALSATSEMWVVRRSTEIHRPVGSLLTLLALLGPADGVEASGVRWTPPSRLVPGETIGVSNEITSSPATVSVADGVILAVSPL